MKPYIEDSERKMTVTSEPQRPRVIQMIDFPKIVCLCGSTRFMDAFRAANLHETLAGNVVLTVGCDTKSDEQLNLSSDAKARLDHLHKQKIALADEILVLNVGGYIGESTRSEIDFARRGGKRVRYLEDPPERKIDYSADRSIDLSLEYKSADEDNMVKIEEPGE